MKALDQYFKLQEEIYQYFGYTEDWKVIPIDDKRDYYWVLTGERRGDEVIYGYDEADIEAIVENEMSWELAEEKGHKNIGHRMYVDAIYTQRFLKKWVYRGKDYTMVCSDPGSDNNKFLSIFSNNKEIKK